jgi:DNA-binding transcriptional MerR regulator
MSTHTQDTNRYSIKEAAKLTGLPESTLRYYETIGLLDVVSRDSSSKHRVYVDDDINLAISVACLSATGMSIGDMRTYLGNRSGGKDSVGVQIGLLTTQREKLIEEAYYLKLRQRYVDTKIAYWKAVQMNDSNQVESIGKIANSIAKELKRPRE